MYERLIEVLGVGGSLLVLFAYGLYLLEKKRVELTWQHENNRFDRLSQTIEKAFEAQMQLYKELTTEVRVMNQTQYALTEKLVEAHAMLVETQKMIGQLAQGLAELTHLTKEELSQLSMLTREREH